MAMNAPELLAQFDREVRHAEPLPGIRRIVTAHTRQDISDEEGWGCLVYSDLSGLDETALGAVIDAEVGRIKATGVDFEWKVYGHDSPTDLAERLAARGFELDEPETVMVLDTQSAPSELLAPALHDVRRVADPAMLADLATVQQAVWGDTFAWLPDALSAEMSAVPDRLSVYIAYADDKPVSTAWVRFAPGSSFAGLWGGSTIAEYRHQGYYTAMLAMRIQEALAQPSVRYLYVDAGEMSRPILEKRGFQPLTTARACNWHPKEGKPVA